MTNKESRFVLTRDWLDSGVETVSAKSLWLSNKSCNCKGHKALPLEGFIEATFPSDQMVQEVVQAMSNAFMTRLSTQTVGSVADLLLLFSDAEIAKIIEPIIQSYISSSVVGGGQSSLGELGTSGVGVGFDMQIPEIQKFVEEYSARLVTNTGNLMNFDLEEILEEGIANGDSLSELTYRTQLWAGEVATNSDDPIARGVGEVRTISHRAELVARTEMNRAYNAGREMSWSQVPNLIVGKVWSMSTMPCEFCASAGREFPSDLTGKIAPVGEPFYTLGHPLAGTDGGVYMLDYEPIVRPPLHPNCRCSVKAVTRTELEEAGRSETEIK